MTGMCLQITCRLPCTRPSRCWDPGCALSKCVHRLGGWPPSGKLKQRYAVSILQWRLKLCSSIPQGADHSKLADSFSMSVSELPSLPNPNKSKQRPRRSKNLPFRDELVSRRRYALYTPPGPPPTTATCKENEISHW